MSTSEKIPLQAVLDCKDAEDGSHTAHAGPLEPDDTTVTSQETSSSSKTAAAPWPTTKSRWKKMFTTVATLIAYAFLNAGISVIAVFYPIVVS